MKTPEPIEAALTRLTAALGELDAAARSLSDEEVDRAKLEDVAAAMNDDRSKLSVELDGALARSRKLEAASEEVARRLREASVSIRAILAQAGERES
jgi:hypothetical protein